MTSRIIGTGSYAPVQIVTNEDLAKIVETNDEWIRTRTGIHERRITPVSYTHLDVYKRQVRDRHRGTKRQ